MLKNPCNGCLLRHRVCHDHCELYLAWKTEQEEFKENERRIKSKFINIWKLKRQ